MMRVQNTRTPRVNHPPQLFHVASECNSSATLSPPGLTVDAVGTLDHVEEVGPNRSKPKGKEFFFPHAFLRQQ